MSKLSPSSLPRRQAGSVLHPQSKRVALGLSGGVDSAVCAGLLKEQGFEVHCFYLECWNTPGCRAEGDRQDALKIALQLDLPFQVLDFKAAYQSKVMNYFFTQYKAGLTPNPDVLCNSEIKFGLFYDWVIANNFDYFIQLWAKNKKITTLDIII